LPPEAPVPAGIPGQRMSDAEATSALSWFIEAPLTARLAALYEHHIGPLAGLIEAAEVSLARDDLLAGEWERADSAAFLKVQRRLATALARHLNLCEQRAPFSPADWKVFLYVLSGARTLRYAIERGGEYFEALGGRLGRLWLHVDGPQARLLVDSLRVERNVLACAIDLFGIGQIHGLFGRLIDVHLPVTRIALDYEDAVFAQLRLPEVPATLGVGEGWSGFAFPATYLDYPVVCAEDDLSDWLSRSFIASPVAIPAPGQKRLADRVRSLILTSLRKRHRLPPFEEVARHFTLSPATLRRGLIAEKTSYRIIKNSCRLELAMELLRAPHATIEDISAKLDFCDSDAFRMAFKQWVGFPPSTYRKMMVRND
jgi:AraC-like DNA-binding protein